MDIFERIRQIEEIRPIGKNENVIHRLSDEQKAALDGIIHLEVEIVRMAHELQRKQELIKAKMVIFSDEMRNANEQAESSESRGKSLAVRKTEEGDAVLVEFGMPQSRQQDMHPFLRMLSGMMQGGIVIEDDNDDNEEQYGK